MHSPWVVSACSVLLLSLPLSAQQPTTDDAFLRGYVTAVLARDFALDANGLTVRDGAVSYVDRDLGRLERQQLMAALRAIAGVRTVTFVPATSANAGGAEAHAADVPGSDDLTVFLTSGRLFEPLLADPRWPHFFASWHRYTDDGDNAPGSEPLTQVGAVGFGETIAIVRQRRANGLRWEAGVQAGVFAIFDLDSRSKDLVNADYTIGPYVAARYRDTSLRLRVYHQSSHLGDEYLLREGIGAAGRVNLSYEAVEVLASQELPFGARAYGGAGYLIDTEPRGLEPWIAQYGAEWRSPWTLVGDGTVRPVLAADLQQREQNDWGTDYSVRAGLLFEQPGHFHQRLAVLLEFYDGRSPNGQFYTDRIQYVGVGLHFYF